MSVYTRIERHELERFLESYALGGLVDYQGISEGIENTNYYVTTSSGQFVLTLFEQLHAEELPYFIDLMAHLAGHLVPCASPVADRHGHALTVLNGKPAALMQRLPGASLQRPSPAQCAAIGDGLARLHLAGQSFALQHENPRGPAWWKQSAQRLQPGLSPAAWALLSEELRFQALYRHSDLPQGLIHGDLFRDNALFEGGQLSGLLDLYSASQGVWLYDLAVTVNDWCVEADGGLDETRAVALLDGYHAVRPLRAVERGAWPVMLRAAALRFWLSRLLDRHFPRAGELTHCKDPDEFCRVLQQHIARGEAVVWRS